MTEVVEIRIVNGYDATKAKPWRKVIMQIIFLLMLFGPGLFFDSAAMQWAGFVMMLIFGLLLLLGAALDMQTMTPDQARRKIDLIEGKRK